MSSASFSLASQLKPQRLRTLLGSYPNTESLKSGAVGSSSAILDFDPVVKAAQGFKRVVQEMAFDVAELSIVTYLIAKSYGKPLVLLPAVMFSRLQHPYLYYDASRGTITPKGLEGRRIGVPYYTTTTSMWLRSILSEDYGVDTERLVWYVQEGPHVSEFKDPSNVVLLPPGSNLGELVLSGELDAYAGAPIPTDPRFRPVIPDPEVAAADWLARHRSVQLNHLVVVTEQMSRERPDLVQEVWRMLVAAKAAAGPAVPGAPDMIPMGVEANRHYLEVAIDRIHRQGLIPHRMSVDSLFDEVTARLVP